MPAMHRAAATKDAPLACGGTGTVAAPPRRCRAWRRCRRGIHQPDAAALVGAPAGGEKNKKKKTVDNPTAHRNGGTADAPPSSASVTGNDGRPRQPGRRSARGVVRTTAGGAHKGVVGAERERARTAAPSERCPR